MPIVPSYAGQNQTALIVVPRRIVFKGPQYSPEDGPWPAPNYEYIFAPVPPRLVQLDLWGAMNCYPL
jgi:hypothetical protein